MQEPASRVIKGRRRHIRAPLRAKVTFTDGKEIRRGFSVNVSESGMFVETLDIFPVGTELTLSFALDGSEERGKVIKAAARVVHSNDAPSAMTPNVPGMGVYFTMIKNSDRDAIADYVLQTKDLYQRLLTLIESDSFDQKELEKLLNKAPIRQYEDLDDLKLKVKEGWRSMEY